MKIKHIVESSAGATTSGSVATVSMPIGEIQKRNMPEKAPKVVKGKKYANVIKEGKMKDLAYDLEHLDNANFKKKYGKTKEEMKSSLKEERISEDDVIVVPGQIKKKDRSFIPHEKDRRDHEVEMARSEIYAAAKDAMRIFKLLKDRSEDQGIMGWQQSYITLASDYLNSVADSLEYQMNMYEMTGGVIAGGMSNFEEGLEDEPPPEKGSLEYRALKRMKGPTQDDALEALAIEIGLDRFKRENKLYREYIPALMHHYKKQGMKEGRYYDPMGDERREQQAMDDERRDFKRREMEYELRNEPKNNYAVHIDGRSWKVFGDKAHAEAVARKLRMKGKKAEVHITGASVSEDKGSEEGFDFKSYYPGAYSRRAVALAEKFCEQYGITDEFDQRFVVEIINAYLTDARGKPVDLKQIKSKLATDLRAVGMKYNMRKKFNEPPDMLKKYPFVKKNLVKEHKCPECGGELVSEEMINEKKDACYYKVKSRYKVWPSAYASGALVKCRKKGSKNWGNKSK